MGGRATRGRRAAVGLGAVAVLAAAGCNLGAPPVSYGVGPIEPRSVVAGDVDGDGDDDLVAVGRGHRVLRNDGTGDLAAGAIAGGAREDEATLADLNGDGDLDLVTHVAPGGSGQEAPAVRFGDGTGAFGAPEPLAALPVEDEVRDVDVADVDGDGDLDLVGSLGERHDNGDFPDIAYIAVVVYANDGRGAFAAPRSWPFDHSSEADRPLRVAVGDLDGDGDSDAVLVTYLTMPLPRGGAVDITYAITAFNDGTGAFVLGQYVEAEESPGTALTPALGDVDEDGDLDIVFGGDNGSWAAATVLLNDGSAGFAAPLTSSEVEVVRGRADLVELADLDGDGHLDLAGTVGPNAGVVAYGDGTGRFGSWHGVGSGTEGAVVDRQLALTDLDGDDDPDIATVGGDTVGVLENVTGRPAH